jgi:hypothetical protein
MKQIEHSETLAFKRQTPVNHPEESTRHSEQGESLKSRKGLQLENGQIQNVFVILSKGVYEEYESPIKIERLHWSSG